MELEKPKRREPRLSPAMRRKIAEAQRKSWERVRERTAASANKPERPKQTPGSPLLDKVVAQLGRPLLKNEARFVRQVQTSFAAMNGRRMTESELSRIAGRGSANDTWKGLDLWRSFPANDFDSGFT